MNIREIKDLINLMNEHNLGEIEIESEGSKIKLRKNGGGHISMETPQPSHGVPAIIAGAPHVPAIEENYQIIKSPMVGTFYEAPAPDAEPYLKVGSKIEVGQVVCIIEAMKLMNEIKSEIKGVVKEILISNGESAEFGKPLFKVA